MNTASMGPRARARGNCQSSTGYAYDAIRFIGAASARSRKQASPAAPEAPASGLQWGREPALAETLPALLVPLAVSLLQWGRERALAETFSLEPTIPVKVSLQWGRERALAETLGIKF